MNKRIMLSALICASPIFTIIPSKNPPFSLENRLLNAALFTSMGIALSILSYHNRRTIQYQTKESPIPHGVDLLGATACWALAACNIAALWRL